MKIQIYSKEIIKNIGLSLLCIFSLGYSLFHRSFAELHVQPSFLDFPLFIGEILLIICFVLSLFVIDFRNPQRWHWAMLVFYIFVLAKAFYGYFQWGPLAFRHAALFYYPIFILFGALFYKRDFFSEFFKIILISFFLIIFLTRWPMPYWFFTVGSIVFILCLSLKNKKVRYFCLFLLFIFFPYFSLMTASRNILLGNVFGIIFLVTALLAINRMKYRYKIVAGVSMIIFVFFVMFKYSFMNAFYSALDIKGNIERFKTYDRQRIVKQDFFKPLALDHIQLYNPEREKTIIGYVLSKLEKKIEKRKTTRISQEQAKPQEAKPQIGRNLEIAYSNAVFRLFVWRDMMSEFFEKKAVLGMDFGWPLRSSSIEILNWGYGEWNRDGWIDAHNSYLTMIYRAGIIGLVFMIFLISLLCCVIRDFIILKSVTGIILCSVFISWFVSANFMPIFEMPYYSIPVWSLFGMTLGYLKDLKKKKEKVS